MQNALKLKEHYETDPPRLSFGGTEGCTFHKDWPKSEYNESIEGSIPVWRHTEPRSDEGLSLDGYCVVNVCLDPSGRQIPEVLSLPKEMEGHEIRILVYLTSLDCISMRAIGGITNSSTKQLA